MKKHYLLLAVAALLLSACGSAKNRAGVDRVPAAAFSSDRDGVIIFSTGTSQPCTGASTFLQVHDEATMKLVPRAAAAPVDGKSGKSDFSDHRGSINAFALPPGRYYLSPVLQPACGRGCDAGLPV